MRTLQALCQTLGLCCENCAEAGRGHPAGIGGGRAQPGDRAVGRKSAALAPRGRGLQDPLRARDLAGPRQDRGGADLRIFRLRRQEAVGGDRGGEPEARLQPGAGRGFRDLLLAPGGRELRPWLRRVVGPVARPAGGAVGAYGSPDRRALSPSAALPVRRADALRDALHGLRAEARRAVPGRDVFRLQHDGAYPAADGTFRPADPRGRGPGA